MTIAKRRELAALLAYSVGVRVRPGCAVAEGILLLVIAMTMAWAQATGALH